MKSPILANLSHDMQSFAASYKKDIPRFIPISLVHVYIKLDFDKRYENASNIDDAKRFLVAIAQSALASSTLASDYEGFLLEIQGSVLHVGLQNTKNIDYKEYVLGYSRSLQGIYSTMFGRHGSIVTGWRIACDFGNTLIISGPEIHGDKSWVSIGDAANRPARHLYTELEKPEDERSLRKFHVAIYDSNSWYYESLSKQQPNGVSELIARLAIETDPNITFQYPFAKKIATASAYPLGPSGSPLSPSPENPKSLFGWVMRADIDGFTSKVKECIDDNIKLQALATHFYQVMEMAASFCVLNKQTVIQLPWAGDCFGAARVFESKSEYENVLPKGIIELNIDFEKEMNQAVLDCGFGGWAHCAAGGEVLGNSKGNVYIAGILIDDRRFIVGVGEGFGRTLQGFADINPKPGNIILYEPDYNRLEESYKKQFTRASKTDEVLSTLFYQANMDELKAERTLKLLSSNTTPVTFSLGRERQVSPRPYYL